MSAYLWVWYMRPWLRRGRLKGGQEKEEKEMNQEKFFCQYHRKTMDHSIQECPEFLKLVQEKINEGEMEFCGNMEEQSVSVLLKEVSKSVTIFYRRGVSKQQKRHLMFPPLDWSSKCQLRFAIQMIRRYHGIIQVKRWYKNRRQSRNKNQRYLSTI